MLIFPAIDLYEKKAVRLFRGDYSRMTVYSEDPCGIAADFVRAGAQAVHLVDLEGAKDGTMPNLSVVEAIAKGFPLFTEVGGGIRDMAAVERCFSAGVDRVILGTAAVTDEDFLKRALARFGDRIAVGVDIKDGCVAIRGWRETSAIECFAFCEKLQALGVANIICTDISKDGAMAGTNQALYRALCERFSVKFTASGGVSSLDDVKSLSSLGIYGAIVGKAYYTGAISLKEAIEAAK